MKTKFLRLGFFLFAFGFGSLIVFTLNKLIDRNGSSSIAELHVLPPEIDDLSRLEIIEDINGWTETDSFKIKLLETGEGFHGDEINAKNGGKWLGLFIENGGSSLREIKILISPAHDGYYDPEDKSKMTGKNVKVKEDKQPFFLLKNAKRLESSTVQTLYKGKTWDDVLSPEHENSELAPDDILTKLKKGFAQVYQIGGNAFELKVIEARNLSDKRILALILQGDSLRQVLHTIELDSNPDAGTLYWAGDLDGDGKPDFYFDLFEHYNVMNRVLFLSSEAENGKLVKKSAQFWTTGC